MCRRRRLRSRHRGEAAIESTAAELRRLGGSVQAVQADLATTEGVDKLCAAVGNRPIDSLLANAGVGLGRPFSTRTFQRIRRVVDTNITGTLYLIHRVGNEMLRRKGGRILITGSIAGFTPGSFQASTTPARRSWIRSLSRCVRNFETVASPSPA